MSDYEVGYKKPPEHTRFTKDKSGNPRGRPKKMPRLLINRQLRADILRVMQERVPVNTSSGRKVMTMHEAILLSIAHGALKGNPTSIRQYLRLSGEAVTARMETHGPLQLLESMLLDEDRAAVALQLMTEDPDYDLVERTKNLV